MPFADKFRAMMDLPLAGDTVGRFLVERIDVGHESAGPGRYVYPIRIMLRGPGGQSGVQRALRTLLPPHTMTFSAYGNAYQLWFGKPEIEALSDMRYAVTVEGAGARVFLDDELGRFLTFLAEEGRLVPGSEGATAGPVVQTYLERYQKEIERKVERYRRRLRKADKAAKPG